MSATKALMKWLKGKTLTEVQQERERLVRLREGEKNPMRRASINERIVMCDTCIKKLNITSE